MLMDPTTPTRDRVVEIPETVFHARVYMPLSPLADKCRISKKRGAVAKRSAYVTPLRKKQIIVDPSQFSLASPESLGDATPPSSQPVPSTNESAVGCISREPVLATAASKELTRSMSQFRQVDTYDEIETPEFRIEGTTAIESSQWIGTMLVAESQFDACVPVVEINSSIPSSQSSQGSESGDMSFDDIEGLKEEQKLEEGVDEIIVLSDDEVSVELVESKSEVTGRVQVGQTVSKSDSKLDSNDRFTELRGVVPNTNTNEEDIETQEPNAVLESKSKDPETQDTAFYDAETSFRSVENAVYDEDGIEIVPDTDYSESESGDHDAVSDSDGEDFGDNYLKAVEVGTPPPLTRALEYVPPSLTI